MGKISGNCRVIKIWEKRTIRKQSGEANKKLLECEKDGMFVILGNALRVNKVIDKCGKRGELFQCKNLIILPILMLVHFFHFFLILRIFLELNIKDPKTLEGVKKSQVLNKIRNPVWNEAFAL